jgi:hypothetical protein
VPNRLPENRFTDDFTQFTLIKNEVARCKPYNYIIFNLKSKKSIIYIKVQSAILNFILNVKYLKKLGEPKYFLPYTRIKKKHLEKSN